MSFLQPDTLDAALNALKTPDHKLLAGGTDVFPSAQQGQFPAAYIDVTRINGLRGISHANRETRIGASTTWSDLVRAELPAAFDGLKAAAREVGSLQIQNAGTIAGNLCNASPAADGVPPLLALDAQIELASAARGKRLIGLDEFIIGVRQTALAPDEMVTAILIPDHPAETKSAFEKLGSRKYLVISICMTAANILMGPGGRIQQARVAIGSCSAVAQRLPELEANLIGQRLGDVHVSEAHLTPLSPIDDVRGSSTYRLDAVREQCRRAILHAGAA